MRMKSPVPAPCLALAASLAVSAALSAQGSPPNPNNENDVPLNNGPDLVYTYNDPSLGPPVGTATASAYFAMNDFFWKVYPREVLRSCSGSLEVSGIRFYVMDSDVATMDASGNNTAFPDMVITTGVESSSGGSGLHPGQIEPDMGHIVAEVGFGDGGPGVNNVFVPWSCACCPDNEFSMQIDVAIGTGAGDGIILSPADGQTDFVITTFIPGGGMSFSGPGACGFGDAASPGYYSSDQSGELGETMSDGAGTGPYSPYGGYGLAGQLGGIDGLHEIACVTLEFAEPMLNMRHDSRTGVGPETGTNGLHLDTSAGATLGARIYAWQAIGQKAAVTATLAMPLPSCVPFLGGALGLDPGDPVFNLLLGLWHSPPLVLQTHLGFEPTFTSEDDGTFTTANIAVPPLPVGMVLPLHFQGFVRKAGGGVQSTQIWTSYLHG